MDSMSSCFVCGVNFPIKPSPLMRRSDSFKNLRESVSRLCELLSVPVTPEDWEGIDGDYLMKQTISCEKCFGLLKNIGRVHDIILKAQKELQVYLGQVELLIIRSESPSLQCSLWKQSCHKLRRGVLSKILPTFEISVEAVPSSLIVKNERRDNYQHRSDSDGHHHFDDSFMDNDQWDSIKSTGVEKTPRNNEDLASTDNTFQAPQSDQVHPPIRFKSKRRRITVIAEEDEVEASEPKKIIRGSGTSFESGIRKAKKSAEEAIRLQESAFSNDNTVGVEETGADSDWNDETYEENLDDKPSESEASGDEDDIDEKKERKKSSSNAAPENPNSGTVLNSGKSKYVTKNGKPQWWAMTVVAENLFLYRRDTFVRKTFTHLECLAYKCGYKTEFDYFSSFQRIRQHLEDNHRSRRHRQRTPHPCLLCNTLLKNREQFNNHIHKLHPETVDLYKARAMCEGCTKVIIQGRVKAHMFSHKNDEEKAVAAKEDEVPYRASINDGYYVPKKRKYPCTFENCTRIYETPKGLSRHKQTHLPKELRTDLTLCPECGVEMLKEYILKHMRTVHHPEMVDRYLVCPFCDKRYTTSDKNLLDVHIRRHKGETPYMCTECGKQYTNKAGLMLHVKNIHETQEYPCQHCDCVYFKKQSLRCHMVRRHPDKMPKDRKKSKSLFYTSNRVRKGEGYGPIQMFPCTECDVLCKYPFTLRKHMANIHGIGQAVSYKRPPISQYRRGGGDIAKHKPLAGGEDEEEEEEGSRSSKEEEAASGSDSGDHKEWYGGRLAGSSSLPSNLY